MARRTLSGFSVQSTPYIRHSELGFRFTCRVNHEAIPDITRTGADVEAKNREINPDAVWHRSSESGGVEVAFLASGNIGLRDAKNPDGPTLIFTPGEWSAFVAGAKDGEFNRPGQ
ncbi:DUF397 domain-containing protein [Nocardia wallacei]|uniref:DUF397 domain-containing protein n=2 Tax=Nocardia TaxID=1817 RepID=UPI00313B3D7C